MKITKRQLRRIIRETLDESGNKLDPDLLKGAYVSSKEEREEFKGYMAKVAEKMYKQGYEDWTNNVPKPRSPQNKAYMRGWEDGVLDSEGKHMDGDWE